MDRLTLDAYEAAAAEFSRAWHDQPAPDDMYGLLKRHFGAGPTADIGCGAGRDVAWLAVNGFAAVGYDPSLALLAQARTRYPGLSFRSAALPELAGIPDAIYANVLCETVLMHLPHDAVMPAIARLMAILRPGGTLYMSWRVTGGADQRDSQGRLYSAFARDLVVGALAGATILHDEETLSISSGKAIHRIVARKESAAADANR